MSSLPGEEFYNERLGRAAALPASERSSDVTAWLHSHAVMEAAAAAMPELPDGIPLVEPLGGKPALAALLRCLAHSFCHMPANPTFPVFTLGHLYPQLPPLLHVVRRGSDVQLQLQPNTKSMLASGGMPCGAADLEATARILLLALFFQTTVRPASISLSALQAAKPWLFDSVGAARLSQQLHLLQQEVTNSIGSSSGSGSSGDGSSSEGSSRSSAGGSGGSSGSGSRGRSSAEPLPTVEQLQVVWYGLAYQLACTADAIQLSSAMRAELFREAASGLHHLQPGNPRSSFWLGEAADLCHHLQPTSVPANPLPHFLRCAQLAREQGSDFWLARTGWGAACASSPWGYLFQAFGPAQASALLAEADAAYQRCKAVVPPAWAQTLRHERKLCAAVLPTIAAHMRQSPQRWRADIMRVHEEGRTQIAHATSSTLHAAQKFCDACEQRSMSLRKCSACKRAAYCSTACQKQHWPVHKAACKVAREAAGSGAGASSG